MACQRLDNRLKVLVKPLLRRVEGYGGTGQVVVEVLDRHPVALFSVRGLCWLLEHIFETSVLEI
jgi:hypothetical protein